MILLVYLYKIDVSVIESYIFIRTRPAEKLERKKCVTNRYSKLGFRHIRIARI